MSDQDTLAPAIIFIATHMIAAEATFLRAEMFHSGCFYVFDIKIRKVKEDEEG